MLITFHAISSKCVGGGEVGGKGICHVPCRRERQGELGAEVKSMPVPIFLHDC